MGYRPRLIEGRLRRLARNFPVVLLTGARQVGKSTTLAHLFSARARTFVFDPVLDLYGARSDPEFFLDQHPPPLILDEIQYAPELLPGIKRRVDARPGAGQYFLTGSQNLAVLRGVSESLAGRAAVVDLEPMTVAERSGAIGRKPWLATWLASPDAFAHKPPPRVGGGQVARALWLGGFPGLLDKPDAVVPDFFDSYVRTYVERDVRLAGRIEDEAAFGRFLALSAALTAQEVNHSQLGREVGVTPQTASRWLAAMQRTFTWTEAPAYAGNVIKRLSQKPKGYLVDAGLAAHLVRLGRPEAIDVSPMRGALFETLVVGEIRKMAGVLDSRVAIHHFRSHGGAEVDLVLEHDGALWPVEIKCTAVLTSAHERGFEALRARFPDARFGPNLVIAAVPEVHRLTRETTVIPWNLA
jgi:uncharacterized protein